MSIRHRYFYTVNGKRVEELVSGQWLPVQDVASQHGPILIRDQLGEGVKGVFNPLTEKTYDSRSAYQRDTKAAGGEIVGNERNMRDRGPVKNPEPVHQTIERLNQQKGWNL